MSFKLPRTVTPELLSHRTVAGTCSWLALEPPTSARSCIHLEHRQFYGRFFAPPCEQLLCVSEGLENALRRHRDFDFNNQLVLNFSWPFSYDFVRCMSDRTVSSFPFSTNVHSSV